MGERVKQRITFRIILMYDTFEGLLLSLHSLEMDMVLFRRDQRRVWYRCIKGALLNLHSKPQEVLARLLARSDGNALINDNKIRF
jgi:hypothetical protein